MKRRWRNSSKGWTAFPGSYRRRCGPCRAIEILYVLDEPSSGLHPLDVRTLLTVFQNLISQGATVIVIEHDLDVIRSVVYIIDMGPGGSQKGSNCRGGGRQTM